MMPCPHRPASPERPARDTQHAALSTQHPARSTQRDPIGRTSIQPPWRTCG
jgi:hypothetical protein